VQASPKRPAFWITGGNLDRKHGTGARDVPESLGSWRVLIVDDDFAGNLLIALFRDMGQRARRNRSGSGSLEI
ncbi:MAG: hypothetical protein WAO20_19205, partial [Acidobacteriota bacterium]